MNYYCTYFDRNYLPRALALFESLERFETGPYKVFAVCLDEVSRLALRRIRPHGVTSVALHEIEVGDEPLLAARADRTLVEYYWTMTPCIMLRLLARIPDGDSLVYLDADMYFYSAPEPIFEEFEGYDAFIHEHRFGPEIQHFSVTAGRFNVGLVGIRNNRNGQEILTWWRERCLEWCFNRFEDGKFGDQLYLDQWPERFEKIRVCEHPGVGLAPWNHDQVIIGFSEDGVMMVNDLRLIIYHFHAYVCIARGLHLASNFRYAMPPEMLAYCHRPYSRALDYQHEVLRGIFPDHAFGLNPDFQIAPKHTVVQSNESTRVVTSLEQVVPLRPSGLSTRLSHPLKALTVDGRIAAWRMVINALKVLGAAGIAKTWEQSKLGRLIKKYHSQ